MAGVQERRESRNRWRCGSSDSAKSGGCWGKYLTIVVFQQGGESGHGIAGGRSDLAECSRSEDARVRSIVCERGDNIGNGLGGFEFSQRRSSKSPMAAPCRRHDAPQFRYCQPVGITDPTDVQLDGKTSAGRPPDRTPLALHRGCVYRRSQAVFWLK